ncbi:MAG: enoyl-[acyl-carrier-protein] reductase FabL [Chloroflexi bacterium]|nr:enoyl-[acyl-carrier-protein] reductase FabL [Chloroflexota bacterium]
MEFQEKVAVVTGGSRGIGKVIALELAGRGAHIAFNYLRSHEEARATQEAVEALGVRCLRVRAHLGDSEQIHKLFQTVEGEFGRVDILVNNAASGVQRTALETEERHWDWTLDINTRAPWECVKEVVRLMPRRGKVINITSLGSQRVLPFYLAVGVSKAGLEALTRYLAVELAPRGISVNAVAGGYVDTDALRHFPNWQEMLRAAQEKTPAGRMVTPQDIARVVAFLCSDAADMIRGQVIVVDGGYSVVA